jgi:hypothetical protein
MGSSIQIAFGGVNPMGESNKQPFQLSFNRFVRVAFQGSRVTTGGGLILVRGFDLKREEHLVQIERLENLSY